MEWLDFVKSAADDFQKAHPDIRILIYSVKLFAEDIRDVLIRDVILVIVAITLVWLYFLIHFRSFFLSAMSMVLIVVSLPIAAVFYTMVFRVTYYGLLHSLILFVVLGISADDLFVF